MIFLSDVTIYFSFFVRSKQRLPGNLLLLIYLNIQAKFWEPDEGFSHIFVPTLVYTRNYLGSNTMKIEGKNF